MISVDYIHLWTKKKREEARNEIDRKIDSLRKKAELQKKMYEYALDPDNVDDAEKFLGNSEIGKKVADFKNT